MSFKAAFTKEDSGRSLLEYDDGAFYYFAVTVLALGLVPWTYVFVRQRLRGKKAVPWMKQTNVRVCGCAPCEDARKRRLRDPESSLWSRFTDPEVLTHTIMTALLWILLFFLAVKSLSTSMRSMSAFNPFEILNIDTEATEKQIKKAFRTLSLKYHPDKNRNDPSSAAKFLLVSKAYHALTDEVAKRNFEKYGNPDGPEMLKLGIGLPGFLVHENSQIFILIVFFIILLVLVPALFISYYQRVREYAPNGLKLDTVRYIATYLNDRTYSRQMAQFVCSAAECRELGMRPTDAEELAALSKVVTVPASEKNFRLPVVQKNEILLQVHLARQSHLLSPGLLEDQKKILKMSIPITKSIIDIAISSNWVPTIRAALDFRQHVFQALELDCDPIMQLPHVTPAIRASLQQRVLSIRRPVDFRDFMVILTENPETCLPELTPDQLMDVKTTVGHFPDIALSATVSVDDEDEIGVGDIATCKVKFVRNHLKEGELQGPVHAPNFPEMKMEEWFFFASESDTGQLLGFQTSKSAAREVELDILFGVRAPGTRGLTVIAISDSYLMIQKLVNVVYTAKTTKELNRKVFVHPEDLALDDAPTLIQSMIGGQAPEESDDSSDEEVETKT